MKRNYLFFWFAVLFCLAVPAQSFATGYGGSCGTSVRWSLDSETGLLEITGIGDIYPSSSWDFYRSSIKKCIIENGVTSIQSNVFKNCTELTSITIPESVTSIGESAFRGCNKLTRINIPNSVTSIGDYAFWGCCRLKSITIPKSVTRIGELAFRDCSELAIINITNSVTSIGEGAFLYTRWYNNQPDGVVYINSLCYKHKGNMPENTSITLKEGTTCISDNAFSYCTGLINITIPKSVTKIGNEAFYGCI